MASAWSQLDQLLTCAICLDRYRNAKLLPCQHTFCMEPCLDGLIDYARRQIKCPECRAEHRIPYKGIQEFPTNVTLMRFLELHRDITGEEPEPPPSMMERCTVCSEKANLEKCAHCDKKICPDCKEAHVDILRREINRINNQVRRGLHRLADALEQTKKNAEKLQLNCSQVKDEIEDIVRRYSKDLKHTEEKLKHDLEIYTESELKSVNKLKEDLEAEVSNMSSNCDLVDKHIKDDSEWTDGELLEYKEIFLKTLDFLRSFDCDNSDFSRRIKFQPRADPDVLHRNIADFGELKINAPSSSSSVNIQQSLAPPTTNALMRSQSDHRLAAQFARRTESRSFTDRYSGHASDNERETGRPTSPLYGRGRRETESSGYRRYSDRNRDYDYDRPNNRHMREDNNSSSSSILSSRWRDSGEDYAHRSRYNRDYDDYDPEPQHAGSRTVRFADDLQRDRNFDFDAASKGPLSGVIKLIDSPKIMERIHQNEVRHKQTPSEKNLQTESHTPQTDIHSTAQPSTPVIPKRAVRQQSEDDIDRQKKANQQATSSSSLTVQQTVAQSPEPPPRTSASRESVEQQRTTMAARLQRKESSEVPATDPVAPTERQETTPTTATTKSRVQPLVTEKAEESDSTTSSSTSSDSRCTRPTLGKALINDGGDSTPAHPVLDKKVITHSSQLTTQSKRNDQHLENDHRNVEELPRPIQSSFFSRQRRLPDPEPRLLENQDSDEEDEEDQESSEDSDSDEDEDEPEEKAISGNATCTNTNNTQELYVRSNVEPHVEEDTEESSTDSSTSESESEESDKAENGTEDPKIANHLTIASDKLTKNENAYTSSSPNYRKQIDVVPADEDYEEILEDDLKSKNKNTELSMRRCSVPAGTNIVDSSSPRFRRRSEEMDTTDSSSGSSSTNYQSFSTTTPVLSNGTAEDISSTENGIVNRANKRDSRYSRRRPFLSRSKSSHELGLGYDVTENATDDDDGENEGMENNNTTSCHRNISDTVPDDNANPSRTRPKMVNSSTTYNRSLDSSPYTSNSSWAKYLKSKYGSSATGKVVPRSRSSHSLYQRSESESSEDEAVPVRNSMLSGSIGFANPRSAYMQKRRMLLKFGSRGTESGNFTWPRGIAVGPDDSIIVADSSNHRVQVFDSLGEFSFEFGSYGSNEGQFDCLSGVAVNRIGQYIVSDRYNQRVQLFDPSGRFLRAFGSEGRTDGRFNYPWGITTDSLGFIYVCDKENHRIQVFQSDGTFVGKFGSIGSRPGQLEHPHYVAVSNTNRVVVSDSNNHRIQIFDVNGRTLSTFGSEGSSDGQFKFPRGVAVDDQGFIVVGDSGNNRIQIFHPDGSFLKGFGSWGSGDGEFKGLEGVAVASSGKILICDRENHRVQVF